MYDTLAKAAIFNGVEPAAAAALADQLKTATFPRSSAIFSEGELGDQLYIILDGKVKLRQHSLDGRENLLAIMGPADMFGELSVFDPGPRTVSAIAVTDVKVATIDRTALRTWISRRPEIAEQLLRVLAGRVRRTNDSLADLTFTDVPGRVAKMLLQLARQFGTLADGRVEVTHDLTQEELAQLVGASRETVNKALTDFRQRGWLRLYGKSVVILDPDRLSHRAR